MIWGYHYFWKHPYSDTLCLFSCLRSDVGDPWTEISAKTILQRWCNENTIQGSKAHHLTKHISKKYRLIHVETVLQSTPANHGSVTSLGCPRATLKPSKNRSIWIEIMKMWCDHPLSRNNFYIAWSVSLLWVNSLTASCKKQTASCFVVIWPVYLCTTLWHKISFGGIS